MFGFRKSRERETSTTRSRSHFKLTKILIKSITLSLSGFAAPMAISDQRFNNHRAEQSSARQRASSVLRRTKTSEMPTAIAAHMQKEKSGDATASPFSLSHFGSPPNSLRSPPWVVSVVLVCMVLVVMSTALVGQGSAYQALHRQVGSNNFCRLAQKT
jgi:hypothetical protein